MSFHLCYLDENGVCVSTRAAEETSQETERRILVDVDDIETYVGRTYLEGVWSDAPAPVKEYTTVFPANILRDAFTTLEKIGALTSTNSMVKTIARILETSQKTVYSTDPLYQQYITLLYDEGIISEETRDDFLKGISNERWPT